MVFNDTFNNISVILWRPISLVEDTGVPGENYLPATNHWQTLSHNVVSNTRRLSGIWTNNDSGDRHWLLAVTQQPYDHDYDNPFTTKTEVKSGYNI